MPHSGGGAAKGNPAPEPGPDHMIEPLGCREGSLSPNLPSLDLQLCQDHQVYPTCMPAPDTVEAPGLSPASWLCPFPLACPQGLDLYLCALPPAPLRTARRPREDALGTKLQLPGLQASPTQERLTDDADAQITEKTDRRLERTGEGAPCSPFHPHEGSLSPPWLCGTSLSQEAFCPPSFPAPLSKEAPFCFPSVHPAYPLFLPPSYVLTYGALPAAQCPPLFLLSRDTTYPPVATPGLQTSVVEPGHHNVLAEPLPSHPETCHALGPTRPSQVQAAGPLSVRNYPAEPKHNGKVPAAKRGPPGSRTGTTALPYPLKKENGRIQYECNQCGKSFGQLSNLKVHLRVHSGERPFQCALCQKSFTQLAHLQKHHLVHTGERPHKCQMCHKGFSSSSNLKTHLRLHAGTRPFQCGVCPSRFAQYAHLNLHHRLHAPQLRRLAYTHLPLTSLTCLARWHPGAIDLVAAPAPSERQLMSWNVDKVKVSLASPGKPELPA